MQSDTKYAKGMLKSVEGVEKCSDLMLSRHWVVIEITLNTQLALPHSFYGRCVKAPPRKFLA